MANIDSLSIQISANTKDAKTRVDALVESLKALVTAINSIDTSKIDSLSNSVQTLANGMSSLKGTKASSLTKYAEALNNISTTGKSAFEPIAESEQKVEEKTDAITSSTKELDENLKRIDKTSLDIVSESAQKLSSSLLTTSSKVDAIKSKFKGIVIPTKPYKSLEEQINKVVNKYNELSQKMKEAVESGNLEEGSDKYQKMSAQLDALRNKYDELILKQKQLAQEGNAVRLNPNVEKTLGAFKSGFSTVTNIVKNGFVAGIRTANGVLKSFKSRIRETLSSMTKSITSGHKATDMAKKFANELLRVSKMLKLMVTRMALRKVIAEVGNGFKSLALHSEEFNQSVSGMMNGAKKLGYSFAAMVSPIINALAPAIQYVINLLVKLLNIINQVFSAFTGKTTYNKSKDFSENWKDNIEAANKGAKDLKKTVLGFDELNQLQDNKNSGGGGSDIVDMFETVDIDPKWKKFADWMKELWKVGDFTDLGTLIGKKIRDMLESIPWELIRKTANKLGGALATLINGFVEVERLGYDIGYTIAQSINTVFEFLNGFVHKLHWDSIGKFIAETFNGFFENIDWTLIKDTVVTGMAGIAESIQTFIEDFHWDNVSDFIVNGVDTVVSGIQAFFEGINWLELGQKMGDQISKSIKGIDFKEVGQAIGDIIKAGIDWMSGMLDSMPSVELLIQKATDLIEGLFDKVDVEQLGKNLATILNGIYDFLVGFWETNGPTIKAEVKKFFKGFWDQIDKKDLENVLGKVFEAALIGGIAFAFGKFAQIYLTTKLKAMITGAASSSAGAATAAGTSIATYLVAGIVTFFAGAEIGKKIGAYLKPEDKELYESYSGIIGTLNMLKDTVVAAYDLWVMKAEEAVHNLKTLGLIIEAMFLSNILAIKKHIEEIVTAITQFKGHVEMKVGEIQTAIKKKVAEIQEDIHEFIKKVKSFFDMDNWTFSGVADGLVKTFKDAKEGIKGIWDSIADKLNGEHEIGSTKFKIRLPRFAYGGFPEDGLFLANHGEMVGQFSNGKTAVANNAEIVAGISAGVYNAVSSAMAQNSNNNGGYIANTIVVDGEVIARTITKAQQRQNMRYSPSMG